MDRRTWLGWMVVAAVGLACGGGGGGGGTADAGPNPSGGPSDGGTPAATATITIQNFRFSPDDLQVSPGTVVTVVNNDSTSHSVTSEQNQGDFTPGGVNGVSFDTGPFARGQRTFTVPANAPSGTVVPYYCTVHLGGMANRGQITIK